MQFHKHQPEFGARNESNINWDRIPNVKEKDSHVVNLFSKDYCDDDITKIFYFLGNAIFASLIG
jgi:hypothetical protein